MITELTSDGHVRSSTSERINAKIDGRSRRRVESYAAMGSEFVDRRLDRLDREWDVERVLELNAAVLSAAGLVLGMTVNKRWLALPLVVATFLAQHAVQGWCPPLPLFRKLGVRTKGEIERERYALMASRGDFVGTAGKPGKSWEAVAP